MRNGREQNAEIGIEKHRAWGRAQSVKGGQVSGVRCQKPKDRCQRTEDRMRKWECGMRKQKNKAKDGSRKSEWKSIRHGAEVKGKGTENWERSREIIRPGCEMNPLRI